MEGGVSVVLCSMLCGTPDVCDCSCACDWMSEQMRDNGLGATYLSVLTASSSSASMSYESGPRNVIAPLAARRSLFLIACPWSSGSQPSSRAFPGQAMNRQLPNDAQLPTYPKCCAPQPTHSACTPFVSSGTARSPLGPSVPAPAGRSWPSTPRLAAPRVLARCS